MSKKNMWELKQSATPDQIDLYIYGDVEEDWYDWWNGEMVRSETSANHFRNELAKYPDAKQINIFINSYGGSVFEGTAIYNQLKRHTAKKVVHIDGFACSIASVIAMAGDEVIMPRNTLMMIHNMWMCVSGNVKELRKAADDLETINSAGRNAYLDKVGDKLSEEQLVEMMDNETWLTAEDCVKYGLADRIAEQDADMSQGAAIMQKANLNISQRIAQHKSLAAQLRALTEPPMKAAAPNPKSIEPAEPAPAEPNQSETGNSIMAMLAGYFNA